MRQINYVCKDLDFNIGRFTNEVMSTFAKNNIAPYSCSNGYHANGKQVYYDTTDRTLLRSGGCCRYTDYETTAGQGNTKPPRALEYRNKRDSSIKTIEMENQPSDKIVMESVGMNNLEKVIEIQSSNYHFFFQSVDLELMFTNNGAYSDFTMQATSILPKGETEPIKVAFFTISDITSRWMGEETAEKYREKTDMVFDIFKQICEKNCLERVSNNRYAELLRCVEEKQNRRIYADTRKN